MIRPMKPLKVVMGEAFLSSSLEHAPENDHDGRTEHGITDDLQSFADRFCVGNRDGRRRRRLRGA